MLRGTTSVESASGCVKKDVKWISGLSRSLLLDSVDYSFISSFPIFLLFFFDMKWPCVFRTTPGQFLIWSRAEENNPVRLVAFPSLMMISCLLVSLAQVRRTLMFWNEVEKCSYFPLFCCWFLKELTPNEEREDFLDLGITAASPCFVKRRRWLFTSTTLRNE